MKKKHILKDNQEFDRIVKTAKPIQTRYFTIFLQKENIDSYYFGFAVSKKHGKAVVRNFIKRRAKNIVASFTFKNGFKCIILNKRGNEEVGYKDLFADLKEYFEKQQIIEEAKK